MNSWKSYTYSNGLIDWSFAAQQGDQIAIIQISLRNIKVKRKTKLKRQVQQKVDNMVITTIKKAN